MQSRHITELRDAIDALRSHEGLAAYPWQTTASVGALTTAAPIAEMRRALDEALGAPSGGKGAQVLWQQTIENGNAAGFSYDLTTSVAAGDQINFVVNKRADNGSDSTSFDPAISYAGAGSAGQVKWLVADQLGTPRMVIDQTGTLSGVRRHDYLPFGEEIAADASWRTIARGYGAGDSVRQKFTGYERDSETGLDYAQARYFASHQGRFTGVDPLTASGRPAAPQTWNRYSYALNNPLRLVDPTGLAAQDQQQQYVTENGREIVDCPPGGCKGELYSQTILSGPQDPIPVTDTPIITDLQIMTGVSNPAPIPEMSANSSNDDVGVRQLFSEFLFGYGPTDRVFGPNSYMTQGMQTSPDVAEHRRRFCEGLASGNTGQYGPAAIGSFGFWANDGPATAGANWPRQFVGSFTMTITPQPAQGNYLFEINNTTSRSSALYHLPFVINNERAYSRSINNLNIMANTRQTYWWTNTVPCPRK